MYLLRMENETVISAYHFKSYRFITVMRARLEVPAKNSPALLFLSRTKAADCCCFSFFFFSLAEAEQSREFLAGTFKLARMMVIKRQDLRRWAGYGTFFLIGKGKTIWRVNKKSAAQ